MKNLKKYYDVGFIAKKDGAIFTNDLIVSTDNEPTQKEFLHNHIRNILIEKGYTLEYINYIKESECLNDLNDIKESLMFEVYEVFEGSIFDFSNCLILCDYDNNKVVINLQYLNYEATAQIELDRFKDSLLNTYTLKKLLNNIAYYNSQEIETY